MILFSPVGGFAFALIAGIVIYRFLIHPAFFSSLSRIPAVHPSARVSTIWMNWQRYHHNEISTLYQAHQSHGPVVLIGPSEISINCVKGGLQTVYLGGFEKPDWYANIFVNFGTANMVSMKDHHSHSIRKRIVSNIYSKSNLISSQALKDVVDTVLYDRFIPVLRSATDASSDIDVYSLFGGATMDIVTGYIYGLPASTNFTTNEPERRRFHNIYFSRRGPDFWLQFPGLVSFFRKYLNLALLPDWFTDATNEIESFMLSMLDKASSLPSSPPTSPNDTLPPSHHSTVLAHLSRALHAQAAKTSTPPSTTRLAIASELMDHTIAGYETSTVTLTYLAWHLSQQARLQYALRAELRAAAASAAAAATSTPQATGSRLPSARTLDALPLLHALVFETLRLHTGAPGPQPRVTPHGVPGGIALGPPGSRHRYAGIPGGVRVAANAWCVHRNEDVFPDARAWRPERWLDGQGRVLRVGKAEGAGVEAAAAGEDARAREMGRWFWAFGSGGRVCVGSHLALYQIKHVIAALYANFETEVVDDEGIEQEDHFLAHPKGHKLILKIKPVDS